MAKIKPVARFARGRKGLFQSDQGSLFFIKDVHPRKVAFTWDPSAGEPAKNLKKASEILTYHCYSSPSLFKPSIAEVLAQIAKLPPSLLNGVVAFETMSEANLVGEFHSATTILYRNA